ncbi:FAD-dependent oxidoreductase [Halarcobacter anaerophilus]|uniref:Succinate dehydrogenase n=1 Tax=Halarcobacter anaerophilus TaxID=877500 RepID=A0A4Q0Y463_9BACT|nr:FAD-dependent oxidoreductase [Halarcobacter anaerophilus]QDF27678.1 succinate dehydrogenase, flavoprotein subunit [Halarcobacter anaerophilus]RXJ64024.1 succinate dehydrogenase [Halarcobacter anaerophilus]
MIDILIIGSGGAGLSAALKAKEENASVLVVSKTHTTHSQTCQAQGGINAVLETTENDSIENYEKDTYKASHKLANKKSLKYFCENSKQTINWLDSIGVPFSRDENNNIAQRKFGGTKAKRTCYSSDYTGHKILHTLYDQCIKNSIDFKNEHLLLKLLTKNNTVTSALFLDIKTGEIVQIDAKTVILATGGYGGIYHNFTTNSYATTGDGIAVAFKAGAKLSNMEFIQFHPTSLLNKNILISESARGEGGYLIDSKGKRFIDELKPRDEVARAIYKKYEEGDKVYLDLTHLGKEKIEEVIPQERRLVLDFLKIKMEEEVIPITPSAHYSMGGILTDEYAQTNIENLFACGECAQSGIHGANRLGGNSLLEIVTFGRLAAKNAAKKAKEVKCEEKNENNLETEKKRVAKILKKEKNEDFYKSKNIIGELLFNKVGLFREKNTLEEALKYLEEEKNKIKSMGIEDKSKEYNKNLVEYLEFENILLLCQIVTNCAYKREESRGAHFRTDFIKEDKKFDKISICKLENSDIITTFEEIK